MSRPACGRCLAWLGIVNPSQSLIVPTHAELDLRCPRCDLAHLVEDGRLTLLPTHPYRPFCGAVRGR